MSFAVLVEAAAEEEWRAAAAWYEEQEPGVGERLNEEVRSMLAAVAEEPDRFPRAGGRTRKAKIIGWPYSFYFAVDRRHQEIKVIAVWHGSRNPSLLRQRIR